jgi:hypothetical protein
MENQYELKKILTSSLKNRGWNGLSFFYYFSKSAGVWKNRNIDKIDNISAVIIIKDFSLDTYLDFINNCYAEIPSDILTKWYKNFSRTIFLFGNPDKLYKNQKNKIRVRAKNYAFCIPEDPSGQKGIRLLLRAVNTNKLFKTNDLNRKKTTKVLSLDISQMRLERYLVHLTHTLFEVKILNLVKNTDEFSIKHVNHPIRVAKKPLYTRVDVDESNTSRLRLYTQLI